MLVNVPLSRLLDFYETYLPAIDEAIDIMANQTSAERAETIKDLQPDFDSFLKVRPPPKSNCLY